MKKYSGNLLSYLNEQTKEAVAEAQSVAQTVEIQMIDANDIIPNTQNFYGIRDIEKLAKSMALSNHVSPLEVLAQDDGKYRLLSGERRRAAVLLRKERGEIEDTHVPCIVREPFVGVDGLTAEQMEMISIISANDYREKTPFEQLDEILKLEPIARVFYEKDSIDADGNTIPFRKFFGEKFLGMSSSALQRILAFQKLLPEARAAFEAGKVSKTALTYLPGLPPEQQAAYFEALEAGTAQGTIAGVQAFIDAQGGKEKEQDLQARWGSMVAEGEVAEPSDPSAPPAEEIPMVEPEEPPADTPDVPDEPREPKASRPPKPPAEDTNVMPEFPTDINPDISPAEVEKDANNWVIESLNCMADMAEQKSKKAADDGHNREAKLWNLRKAAVELVIETIS